ncbi:MAG TPA: Ig-like domain repeat protein [Bryobacterales bacterium]|nr:Ig-like domain repeat protein [Bryobacterales bacterium]
MGAPTIAKAFAPTTIQPGGTSTITFTLTNPNATVDLTGVAFTDGLPAGLQVAATPSVATTCPAGATFAPSAGDTTLNYSTGTITKGTSCTVSVSVTGTTGGMKSNTTGAISSTNGGTGVASNTATVNVTVPTTLTLSAPNPASVPFGSSGPVSLSATLTQTSGGAPVPGATITFKVDGGTVGTGTTDGTGVATSSYNPSGLPAGNHTVQVFFASQVISSITYEASMSGTQTLTVVAPPSISKSFNVASIPLNSTATVTFMITNPATNTVSLTGVAFTDTLPTGMVVAALPNITGTCGGGTITAVAGMGSISLSGATLATSGSCTFSVDVKGAGAGSLVNSVQVTSTNGGTGNTAMATLIVVAPPTIKKAFANAILSLNSTTTLMFTLTNPAANTVAETGVAFSDSLPGGLVVADTPGAVDNCGGTFTPIMGASSVGLTGGSIAVGSNCTISVSVKGVSLGNWSNITGAVSSTNGGTGTTSNTAKITVVQPTTTTVSAASVQYSDVVTLSATVSPAGSPGSVEFYVNSVDVGAGTYNSGTGVATFSYQDLLPVQAGGYTIKATYNPSNPFYLTSSGTNTLTVTQEDAVVTSSPVAVQVTAPGSNASQPFSISATITEKSDDTTYGDISNAVPVTCTLTPIGPGSGPPVQTAAITGSGGAFAGASITATCSYSGVAVNVYLVTFTIGGNYYTGTGNTVLTVYDPSLGFTTGGGTIINPSSGAPGNFGFNVKYLKNGNVQGSLLYIDHRATGDVMLKSNAMGGLAIPSVPGNEAIFNGKATYQGVGNYTFITTAIDNGEPGVGKDQFGLQVNDPSNTAVPGLTFSPTTITGGNIQVPQPSKK